MTDFLYKQYSDFFRFFVNLGDKNNAYKFPKHFSANILVSNIRSYKCM